MAKQQVYDASAIQALKGLEPVRRMPGMYTHTVHPLHIVQEAVDNAIDEALAGFGKKITITVRKDGSVEVEDEGRSGSFTDLLAAFSIHRRPWRGVWARSASPCSAR